MLPNLPQVIALHLTIHKQQLISCTGHRGRHHQAQLVDDPLPLKGSVEDAASLQKELPDSK